MIARHRSAHRTSYDRTKWQSACAHEKYEVRTKERGRHMWHEEKNLGFKYALMNVVRMKNDDGVSSDSRNVLAL